MIVTRMMILMILMVFWAQVSVVVVLVAFSITIRLTFTNGSKVELI